MNCRWLNSAASKLFLPIVLITAACSPESRGESFYVSVSTGNDSNNGSASSPWRTIQKAAKTVGAGATVIVSTGVYNERVQIRRSGSPGFPITYQAQGSVIMRGFTINASYIRINGFEITNSSTDAFDGTGVFLKGASNEVRDNYIHDLIYGEGVWVSGGANRDSVSTQNNLVSGNRIVRARMAGIMVEGINNLVEGNDISHSIQNPPGAPARSGADADGIRFFGAGTVIRKNYIHDIHLTEAGNHGCFEGAGACPHIDVFQTWGPASNIIFEDNVAYWTDDGLSGRVPLVNPQWAMIEAKPGAAVTNLIFKNNVFMHETTRFGPMNFDDDLGGPINNITIVNNTFVRLNGPGSGGGEYAIVMNSGARLLTNATIQNNVFYDCGSSGDSYVRVNGFTADVGHNAVYMSSGSAPAGGPSPNDLWMVNPKFVNFAGKDFHLQATSPLIDRGATLPGVSDDLDGVARPQRLRYDIGAYETP